MAIKKNRKGKKHVNAKKASIDGIDFRSGLEKFCYQELKNAKLFDKYEDETFQVLDGFELPNISIEKQMNGKGELKNRGQCKVRGISYTPDFTGKDYIIEVKGRPNESFSIRWKLFKKHITDVGDNRPLYMPRNQKEVSIIVNQIKDGRRKI